MYRYYQERLYVSPANTRNYCTCMPHLNAHHHIGTSWRFMVAGWRFAVEGLRGWRFTRLAVRVVGGWRFARLAVCAFGGWRFGQLAVCVVGGRGLHGADFQPLFQPTPES